MDIANNEWGYRTRKTRKAGDRPMSLSGLYRIFHNKFYYGIIQYTGGEYEGKHRPMIREDEFWRVQDLLGKKGVPRPKNNDFAFTGLVTCEECGSSITAETKRKYIKSEDLYRDYTYYRCTKRKSGVKCTQKGCVNLHELERQIMEEISDYAILPIFKDWALEVLNKKNDKEVESRATIYEAQQNSLNTLQRELDSLTKMRYRELIDDGEYLKQKKEITTKLNYQRVKMRDVEGRADKWLELTEETFDLATNAIDRFKNGSPQKKRDIFNAFFDNSILDNKELVMTAHKWFMPIKEQYPALEEEYKRLELKKPISSNDLQAIQEKWWRWRESNPRP